MYGNTFVVSMTMSERVPALLPLLNRARITSVLSLMSIFSDFGSEPSV